MARVLTDNERSQYLVRALQPDIQAQVSSLLEADPSIDILRRLGPLDGTHTLVVSMSAHQADALKKRFAGQLVVERDSPLTPFTEA